MALDKNFINWLKEHYDNDALFNEPMSRHTSFRTGGPADVFIEPKTTDDAVRIINKARKAHVPVLVIGDGTNLIVTDKGIRGAVLVLSGISREISMEPLNDVSVLVQVNAGTKTHAVCRFAIDHGLNGMNFAIGIPGTIGGNIAMNAGTATGSMDNVVSSLSILNGSGTVKTINRSNLDFSYRRLQWPASHESSGYSPVILKAAIVLEHGEKQSIAEEAEQLIKLRKANQPVSKPNAGCIFKNPEGSDPAGKLIDMAGLKGRQIGGAQISDKHANFIINRENATADDIISLLEMARNAVKTKFNITATKTALGDGQAALPVPAG